MPMPPGGVYACARMEGGGVCLCHLCRKGGKRRVIAMCHITLVQYLVYFCKRNIKMLLSVWWEISVWHLHSFLCRVPCQFPGFRPLDEVWHNYCVDCRSKRLVAT